MREGGRILAAILSDVEGMVRPGIRTEQLSARVRELLDAHGVEASFLGYRGYPDVICLSVNHQAVHTPGSDYTLQEGDLLKLDFGIYKDGLHTDSARTLLVSNKPVLAQRLLPDYRHKRRLMHVTKQALDAGIAQCQPGNHLGDVSHTMQSTVEDGGFTIVRELGGHGIGRELHEEPFVPNFGKPGEGPELKVGMVLALEPITCTGKHTLKDGVDGFTYELADGSLSAHFEHTVAITKDGPEILTR
jgi:methionyl aminopeptidase